mgnify:FL=1
MMGTEAMALGCVVVTKKDNSITNVFDAPVCDVVFETLYEKLKELIVDKNKRAELALKARAFVEKNNDCKKVSFKMIEKLEKTERDYSSTYFDQKSGLLNSGLISQKNLNFTDQVKQLYQKKS